jgi:hypothetical protein
MPTEVTQPEEPADAGCVDDSAAVIAADATAQDDQEPEYEEIHLTGGAAS